MTYIVMELQTIAEGNVANLVYAYTDRAQAEQKFHLIASAAAASSLPMHSVVMFTNYGTVIERKVFIHSRDFILDYASNPSEMGDVIILAPETGE